MPCLWSYSLPSLSRAGTKFSLLSISFSSTSATNERCRLSLSLLVPIFRSSRVLSFHFTCRIINERKDLERRDEDGKRQTTANLRMFGKAYSIEKQGNRIVVENGRGWIHYVIALTSFLLALLKFKFKRNSRFRKNCTWASSLSLYLYLYPYLSLLLSSFLLYLAPIYFCSPLIARNQEILIIFGGLK